MKAIALLIAILLLAGCIGENLTSVSEIKTNPDKYLGEKVVVKGIVTDSFKIGKLSGFRLEEGGETITVSSSMLPAEGEEVEVEGTVMKEVLIGYYILAKDIR